METETKKNDRDYSSLSYGELANLIGLPMKIYATLKYVTISPDGDIVLYLNKKNRFKLMEYAQKLKIMEEREIFLHIDEGFWNKPDDTS